MKNIIFDKLIKLAEWNIIDKKTTHRTIESFQKEQKKNSTNNNICTVYNKDLFNLVFFLGPYSCFV